MAKTFELEVVTPERLVMRSSVDYVTIPTVDGFYGILADHAPMVCLLHAGVVHFRKQGESRALAITGGFCEIEPQRAVVLADEAELPEDINVAEALEERNQAREIIEAGGDAAAVAKAKEALQKAMARLRAAGRE